jgi:DNA/RNA endonuclease G (NUC1)
MGYTKFEKMKNLLFLFLILSRITVVFSCDLEGHFDFEVKNEEIILYYGCYDAINKGPHITEYILTKERIENRGANRPSVTFTKNRDGGTLQSLLKENGYSLPGHSDYTRSGYDRGHMAPNADFNDTYKNAELTFFIANIWPQLPVINRIEWLKTENFTRRLAIIHLAVKVVIIVDEFSENKVKDIQVPSCFKKRVYNIETDDLIYDIDVYQ